MRFYRLPIFVTAVLLLGACTLGGPTRPSQFYVLHAEPGTPVSGASVSGRPVSLGIGPVTLPDTVNRPQIVTRHDDHRILLAEFDRWGGDLGKDLVRVLSQNLMSRLDTDAVVDFPWTRRDHPDFQVSVRFFHFDGQLGQRAELAGLWQLRDGADGCQLHVERFYIAHTPADAGYPAFVAALSAGVAELSQSIAARIAATQPGCEG